MESIGGANADCNEQFPKENNLAAHNQGAEGDLLERIMCEIPLSEQQIQDEFDRLNTMLSATTMPQQHLMCLLAIRDAMDWMLGNKEESPYNSVMSGKIEKAAWCYLQVLEQIEANRLKWRSRAGN